MPRTPLSALYKILVSIEAKLFFFIKYNLDEQGGIDMTQHKRKLFTEQVHKHTGHLHPDQSVKVALVNLVKMEMLERVGRGRYKINQKALE